MVPGCLFLPSTSVLYSTSPAHSSLVPLRSLSLKEPFCRILFGISFAACLGYLTAVVSPSVTLLFAEGTFSSSFSWGFGFPFGFGTTSTLELSTLVAVTLFFCSIFYPRLQTI